MFHTCSNHLCAKSSGVAGCFFPSRVYPHILIPLMCSPSHQECSSPNVSSGTTPSCLEGDVIAHGRQGDFPPREVENLNGWQGERWSKSLIGEGLVVWSNGESLEWAWKPYCPSRPAKIPKSQRWFSWNQWWRSSPMHQWVIYHFGRMIQIDTLAIHVNLFAFRFLTLLTCGSWMWHGCITISGSLVRRPHHKSF